VTQAISRGKRDSRIKVVTSLFLVSILEVHGTILPFLHTPS